MICIFLLICILSQGRISKTLRYFFLLFLSRGYDYNNQERNEGTAKTETCTFTKILHDMWNLYNFKFVFYDFMFFFFYNLCLFLNLFQSLILSHVFTASVYLMAGGFCYLGTTLYSKHVIIQFIFKAFFIFCHSNCSVNQDLEITYLRMGILLKICALHLAVKVAKLLNLQIINVLIQKHFENQYLKHFTAKQFYMFVKFAGKKVPLTSGSPSNGWEVLTVYIFFFVNTMLNFEINCFCF